MQRKPRISPSKALPAKSNNLSLRKSHNNVLPVREKRFRREATNSKSYKSSRASLGRRVYRKDTYLSMNTWEHISLWSMASLWQTRMRYLFGKLSHFWPAHRKDIFSCFFRPFWKDSARKATSSRIDKITRGLQSAWSDIFTKNTAGLFINWKNYLIGKTSMTRETSLFLRQTLSQFCQTYTNRLRFTLWSSF
jgi:hypothetical protein